MINSRFYNLTTQQFMLKQNYIQSHRSISSIQEKVSEIDEIIFDLDNYTELRIPDLEKENEDFTDLEKENEDFTDLEKENEDFNVDHTKLLTHLISNQSFNRGLVCILDSISEEHEVETIDSYLELTSDNLSKIYKKKEEDIEDDEVSVKTKISIKSQCGSIESKDVKSINEKGEIRDLKELRELREIREIREIKELKTSLVSIDIKSDGYQDSVHDSSTHNGSDFERISLSDRLFHNSSPFENSSLKKNSNFQTVHKSTNIEKMNIVDVGVVLSSTLGMFRRFVS